MWNKLNHCLRKEQQKLECFEIAKSEGYESLKKTIATFQSWESFDKQLCDRFKLGTDQGLRRWKQLRQMGAKQADISGSGALMVLP